MMSTDFEREIGSSMMPTENPRDFVENSKWIEEYRKRLAILLPKMTEAKKKFLDEAAHIFKISEKELIEKAKELFRENFIREAKQAIQRQEARISKYKKSPEYLKKAEEAAEAILAGELTLGKDSKPEPIDSDFVDILNIFLDIKQDKSRIEKRADQAVDKMSEYDIMRTIRIMLENNASIEELYQAWEKPCGDINALQYEASKRGIPKKLLDIDNSYMGEVYIGFVKSVESGYLIDMNNGKYKITKSLRAFLEFLGANNIPCSLQILRDRLLKFSGDPYKEGTLKKELQRHPSNT